MFSFTNDNELFPGPHKEAAIWCLPVSTATQAILPRHHSWQKNLAHWSFWSHCRHYSYTNDIISLAAWVAVEI